MVGREGWGVGDDDGGFVLGWGVDIVKLGAGGDGKGWRLGRWGAVVLGYYLDSVMWSERAVVMRRG